MAKRGFFAELNYQAQQAEKQRRQQDVAAVRAHNAAVREAERAQRAAERARATASRAAEAQRKAAEKEAARLQVEARTAEVEAMNKELAASYEDIDTLLGWTLGFDDFVDLETLKSTAEHPSFDPGKLGTPVPTVPELVYPAQPNYVEPPAPKALSGAFGGKKRHAEAVQQAQAAHEQAQREWHDEANLQHAEHVGKLAARETAEADRLVKLAEAEEAYKAECAQREADAATTNEELTKFINDLAFDVEYAIEDYVGIVLSNSVYPDAFPVEHEHSFDLATRELTLQVNSRSRPRFPGQGVPLREGEGRDHRKPLPAKTQKDRFNAAVHQVALRTLHEVFEADRAGKSTPSPSRSGSIGRAGDRSAGVRAAVVAAADRDTFNSFDLANVVPAATLDHLGAAVSKSPFDLTPADTSRGVRQRSQ